jgi:predicted RNase H-like HicB family nuclease
MADAELTVHVHEDDVDGGFVASIPARPGVLGQGDTPAAAITSLAAAIELADEVEATREPTTDEKLDELQAAIERLISDGTDASVDDVARLFVLLGTAVGLARILRTERDEARRSPATVYVTTITDRHADPEAVVFSTADLAIGHARQVGRKYAREPEDYQETPVEGWLFHANYSCESDSVRVEERPVHLSPITV